jgi:PAS domain S-box-containing protein
MTDKKKHNRQFKIIIIEDDKGLNRLISKKLEKEGFETDSALKGKEALAKINGQEDQIVLVDYKLPDMNAKELISRLQERNLDIPFLVMTGHGDEQTAVEMMKMGASDYLIKQNNFIELLKHRTKKVCGEIEKEQELKDSQEELKKSEKRFRSLYESMNEGICLHELIYNDDGEPVDYKIIDVNPNYEKILGIKKEEAVGKLASEVYESKEPPYLDTYAGVVESGQSTHFETYYSPMEKYFHISVFSPDEKKFATAFSDITEKKKSEKRLKEKEENLRTTLNSIGDAVISTDLAGRIVRMNPVAERLTGWEKDAARSKPVNEVFKIVNANTRETLQDPVSKVLEKGEIVDLANNSLLIAKNGKEYQIADSGAPIKDDDGNISGVVLVFRDVTEEYKEKARRKKREKELQEYKDRLEGTMRIGNLAWWEMDIKSGQVKFNQQKAKMLGYNSDEFNHFQDFMDLVHPDDYERTMQAMRDHFQGKNEVYKVDYRIKSRDGDYRWFHDVGGITSRDEEGKPQKVTGVVVDITETKKLEEKFKNIWQSAQDGMRVTNEEGIITAVNPAFCDLVDMDRSELVGQPLSVIYSEDSDYIINKHCERFSNHTIPKKIEDKFKLHNGEICWFEVVNSYVNIPDEPEQILGIFRDITDYKEAEEEKEQLHKQLMQAQKLESIGTLAGGVAHDFNNILTVIIGLSQLVLTRMKKSDPNYEKMESILNSAERASELTRQLLLFSRKKEMDLKIINLNDTISKLRKMLNRLIGEDIKMHNNFCRDLWPVNADENQIEQVITNLTVNARDAMPAGGELTISTQNVVIDEEKAKTIPDIKPGKYVCLCVEDTGTGIEKSIQEQIFDPFFTTKGRAEGTGMGLSVVHGIIKKHGGLINVYSEPGEGTIFKIYLPAVQEEEFESEKEEGPENFDKYAGSQETLLIVEDEKPVLTYLEGILDNYGYNYLSATCAEEALELFNQNKEDIDLLISDVIMTGMDGVALADQLKEEKKDLKVILSSGYSDKKVSKPRIKEKGYRFIQKPYDVLNLLKTIHKTITENQ